MANRTYEEISTPWWRRYAGPLVLSLFLVVYYWRGLDSYFYQDDFGWLQLGPAKSFSDFLHIAFAPKAHGNLRPWSENLFFYTLKALFGLNALPFKVVIMTTAVANVWLLERLARRLTGSALAGGAAALVWLATPAVAGALCWTCIYNQTQCVFFLLLATVLFVEERERWCWAAFVLGLGSLELMVVFPALVTLWALLFAPGRVRRALPLFAVSIAFTLLHFAVAPAPKSGPYAIQIDARIFRTLGVYTEMALGPERLTHFMWEWPAWVRTGGTALMALLAAGCVLARWRVALFGVGWFLCLLAPVVVLPDHIMDYLLVGPAVGVAFVFTAPLACSWRWKWLGLLATGAYLCFCLPAAWKTMTWNYERSQISRRLVEGVVAYDRAHPGRTLLLTGMDAEQFVAGFADLPFHAQGMTNVWLLPGAEKSINDAGHLAPLFVPNEEKMAEYRRKGPIAVLDVSGGNVREIQVPIPAGPGSATK